MLPIKIYLLKVKYKKYAENNKLPNFVKYVLNLNKNGKICNINFLFKFVMSRYKLITYFEDSTVTKKNANAGLGKSLFF